MLLWKVIQDLVTSFFSVKLLPTTAFTRFQNKLQELRKAGFYRENQLDYPGIHHFGISLPQWGDILSEGEPSNTGKSLSEALLFAEHGENIMCTKIVLNVRNNFCTLHVLPRVELGIFMYLTFNSMNNLLLYCRLVDAKN